MHSKRCHPLIHHPLLRRWALLILRIWGRPTREASLDWTVKTNLCIEKKHRRAVIEIEIIDGQDGWQLF